MSVAVDTSGILAVLNGQDVHHAAADAALRQLVADEEPLVCTSYVLLESFALVQNRLGMDAVRDLQDRICPILEVEWVGQDLHDAGVAGLVAANRRQLSLVDCVSFAAMRRLGIERVFTFDAHFGEQGFQLVPGTT